MATLTSIRYQPLTAEYEDNRFDHFLREPLQTAQLVSGHGIQGDRKARPGGRQLNLLDTAWLETMAARGFDTRPGAFGEQLIVDGIDLLGLAGGTRIRIGSTALIEINRPRDGCIRLQAAQGSEDDILLGHIGQLARVIEGGEIRIGDELTTL